MIKVKVCFNQKTTNMKRKEKKKKIITDQSIDNISTSDNVNHPTQTEDTSLRNTNTSQISTHNGVYFTDNQADVSNNDQPAILDVRSMIARSDFCDVIMKNINQLARLSHNDLQDQFLDSDDRTKKPQLRVVLLEIVSKLDKSLVPRKRSSQSTIASDIAKLIRIIPDISSTTKLKASVLRDFLQNVIDAKKPLPPSDRITNGNSIKRKNYDREETSDMEEDVEESLAEQKYQYFQLETGQVADVAISANKKTV
jgi:hypothetical protein